MSEIRWVLFDVKANIFITICSLKNKAAVFRSSLTRKSLTSVRKSIGGTTAGSFHSEDVPIVTRIKFPANAHVLSIASSQGDLITSQFFSEKRNCHKRRVWKGSINSSIYVNWYCVIRKVIHVFRQNKALTHTKYLVQNLLSVSMYKIICGWWMWIVVF